MPPLLRRRDLIALAALSCTQRLFAQVPFAFMKPSLPVTHTTTSQKNFSGSSTTLSHTVGSESNRLLIVVVGINESSRTVSSMSYGGTAMTKIHNSGGTVTRVEMWCLVNPPAGTANVSVTLSGSSGCSMGALNFFNVNQTTPYGAVAAGNSESGAPSVSVTSTAGQLAIDAIHTWATNPAVGPGQTQIFAEVRDDEHCRVSIENAAAGSTTMSWTASSDKWRQVATVLNPP